jgi:hypothetical protein
MGSDWEWELQLPDSAPEPVLRRLYRLAADRNLQPQRPDGLINLFPRTDAEPHTVHDLDTALAAMATGDAHGQFWTNGDVDIYVNLQANRLVWALDSCFCYRSPVPEAEQFRELHHRLTGLWIDIAQDLNAHCGRVVDEWSIEQVWSIHDTEHPIGGWPAALGWWTYLSPDHRRPPPPLPEIAARTSTLPNGGLLVALLDDPAAVDELHFKDIHKRWLPTQ